MSVDESAAAAELVDVLARRIPAFGGTIPVGGVVVAGPDRLGSSADGTTPAATDMRVVAPPHHAAILSGTIGHGRGGQVRHPRTWTGRSSACGSGARR